MQMYKRCGHCKETKLITEFHNDKKGSFGKSSRCKPCANKWSRFHHHRKMREVPEYKEAQRNNHFKTRYGISADEYDSRCSQADKDGCAICGIKQPNGTRWKDKWHLDHCHSTGKVRGMLCGNCNRGLGQFQDSEEIMTKAIDYLKKHRETSKEGNGP